jgi:hypothetical protein
MRPLRFISVSLVVCGVLTGPAAPSAFAQGDAQAVRQEIDQLRRDFEALKQQYGDRIAALEARLGSRPGEDSTAPTPTAGAPQQPTIEVPAGAAGAGGPTGSLPVYGAASAASKIFNPDIAVIGDFLGAMGSNTINPSPALEMHESEASFQAVVDPYARADFFIAFGQEGVEVEEGYVTFPTLPGGILAKVGKMRAAFGKVNTLHNHVLPWTDRPLVIDNLVGGEEGISDAGLSIARLVPNPWIFLEATGQVLRGNSGGEENPLFRSSRRSDLAYVGHLRAYHDVTEDSNVDLGLSFAHGHNAAGLVDGTDQGRFKTRLFGVDATYRWRPLQRSIYHSFVGRSEVIWNRRDQFAGPQSGMGWYVAGDYQFARRWFAGVRFDRSDRTDDDSLTDSGQSVMLTFWPSEFGQLRGQFRRTTYAGGPTANELLFQFQFAIGAHGAHPF